MQRSFWIPVIFLLSLSRITLAQTNADWNGNFQGSILGADAILIGNLDGNHWTGTISMSGYPIQFDGTVIDMKCTGTMTDAQTKNSTPFTAHYAGRQITINIHDINPISGQEENMEFIFLKTTEQQVINSAISNSVAGIERMNVVQRDQSLVGLWRYTDTYVSGESSIATDYFMQVNSNGTILLTDGRTAGGDPTTSIDSGDSDTHQGFWKTENNTLWTKDDKSQWQSYAHYILGGNSLMLTYNNGKKQVWERRE